MKRIEYKVLEDRDEAFLVKSYIHDQKIEEPPTQDSILLYTLHKLVPDLKKGILMMAYMVGEDEIVGYCRSSATFDPETQYIHEFHAVNSEVYRELYEHMVLELQKYGVRRIIWYPYTEWNIVLNELFSIDVNNDALEFAILDIPKKSVEIRRVKEGEYSIYCQKPLITDVATREDLRKCYEIQKATNWGEFSTPPRIFLPTAFLHKIGYRSGYMIVARDPSSRVIGFVRVSATMTPRCVYGHEQVILPEYIGRGLGTAVDTVLSIIAIENGVAKAYGTIDPTNIRSLALSLREVGMRGIAVEENLFGYWATTESLGGITHRIIVVFDDRDCYADAETAIEYDIEQVLELANEGKKLDLGRNIILSMGIDIDEFQNCGHVFKEMATEALKYLMNVCHYALVDVMYEDGDTRYLLTLCDGISNGR